MVDQAEKLRRLMTRTSKGNREYHKIRKSKAQVISITSGKGGVGKTNFTINLAIALKRLGYEVVVFDGDIGLANVEIISGTIVRYTIADLLRDNTKDVFSIMSEGPEGIKLISGGSGLNELSLMSENNLNRIINQLKKLEEHFDLILIDTGAGLSEIVIKLIMASDEVIIVITPDPTALTDGYALIKALVIYGYNGILKLVINMVESKREVKDVYKKISTATNRFLGIDLEYIGYFDRSKVVTNAVKTQKPFIISNPNSQLSKKIKIIALSYMKKPNKENSNKKISFAEKLKQFFFG